MTQKRIKIGFTGAQGVGKTTSAYSLSTKLKKLGFDVNIVTEAARSCPFEINENATVKAQLWIFAKMLERELESTAQITICDRTLLDVLVYTHRVSPSLAEELSHFISGFMNSYTIIFYNDINEKYLIEDGIRSTNKVFQNEIKNILDEYIKSLDIQVVKNDSEKERLKLVIETIEK